MPISLRPLLHDLSELRRRLDQHLELDREQFDQQLDQSYAELVELADQSDTVSGIGAISNRVSETLIILSHSLQLARHQLERQRIMSSSLEGELRELQDRVMKMINVWRNSN